MYTDGIIEATDAAGDFFGDARFIDFVQTARESTPEVFVDQLIKHLKSWSGRDSQAGLDDDVTLIVIDAT